MFKKIFIILFISGFLSFSKVHAEGDFLSTFTCTKDMNAYYPLLIEGTLPWPQQKRFFKCLHSFVQLLVEKNLLNHDPSRDYFTKSDISHMLHAYLEYDEDFSKKLAEQIFFIKKLLIGGSIDQLKDTEVKTIYRLVYDFQEIYYVIRKQIPVLRKIFTKEGRMTPEERDIALEQFRKAFIFLERAYTREKVIYNIDDLDQYAQYMQMAGLIQSEEEAKVLQQSFSYIHHQLAGVLFPNQGIQGLDWSVALGSLRETLNLFLYYKTYLVGKVPTPAFTFHVLGSIEIFLSSLQPSRVPINYKGFPFHNLDNLFHIVLSFFNNASSSSEDDFFIAVRNKEAISLFTRTLSCFSLDHSADKNCHSEWGRSSSQPVVSVSFEDVKFDIVSDKMTAHWKPGKSLFLSPEKIQKLEQWLANYKESLLKIHSGDIKPVAVQRRFAQWLNPFFGWDRKFSRVEFGTLNSFDESLKAYQLLNYQALIPLLTSNYWSEYSSSQSQGAKVLLSFEQWNNLLRDLTPALALLQGQEGYNSSWKDSLNSLFYFANTFLYSSNKDNFLSREEFIDLVVHLMEGVKNSQQAYKQVAYLCGQELDESCVVEALFRDKDLLKAYPRFQKHLLASDEQQKYRERMEFVLRDNKNPITTLSFLPLFLLLQIMELNYELIDQNKSSQLESVELLPFIKHFESQVASRIPYLRNKEQARSYLMYALKTGSIPFFTGHEGTTVEFANWHLNPEDQKPFSVSRHQFHFLIFDFYKIYKSY